jgi:hypothetical protein
VRKRTRDELKKLAADLAAGDIYTSLQVEDRILPLVFMPLAMLSREDVETLDALPREQQPGIFFEYLDKAGPRSINGHPIFWSVQWIEIGQAEEFMQLFEKARKGFEKVREEL